MEQWEILQGLESYTLDEGIGDLCHAAISIINRNDIEIAKLQANNNYLRDAFEEISFQAEIKWIDDAVTEALSATPAESLAKHDDEVLSKLRVRNWTQSMNIAWHKAIPDLHKAFDDLIEALKGK